MCEEISDEEILNEHPIIRMTRGFQYFNYLSKEQIFILKKRYMDIKEIPDEDVITYIGGSSWWRDIDDGIWSLGIDMMESMEEEINSHYVLSTPNIDMLFTRCEIGESEGEFNLHYKENEFTFIKTTNDFHTKIALRLYLISANQEFRNQIVETTKIHEKKLGLNLNKYD